MAQPLDYIETARRLVGATAETRRSPAWLQAYRAVEHGHAKNQCSNKTMMEKFPSGIEDFAASFKQLQEKRHQADYDPSVVFSKTDVGIWIDTAEDMIKAFHQAPNPDRRAFAVRTAMKRRSE